MKKSVAYTIMALCAAGGLLAGYLSAGAALSESPFSAGDGGVTALKPRFDTQRGAAAEKTRPPARRQIRLSL